MPCGLAWPQTTELDEKHQVHDTAVLDEARVLQTQHSFLHHEAEELAAHAGGSAASIATMPLLQLDEDSRSQPQGVGIVSAQRGGG